MLPVFMILRCKIYFMRAPARNTEFSKNRLYRQTEAPQWGAFFVLKSALIRERRGEGTPPDGDTSLIPQNPSGWLLCQFHAVWRMVLRAL